MAPGDNPRIPTFRRPLVAIFPNRLKLQGGLRATGPGGTGAASQGSIVE